MTDIVNMQMILCEPMVLSYAGGTPSYAVSRGTGGANLNTQDPREVFLDNGAAGSYMIDIDLGIAANWDTVALINVSAGAGATWGITGGATYTATTYLPTGALRLNSEDGVIDSGVALFWSPAVINGRYIRITVTPNGAPVNSIGTLVVSRSFKPSKPREQGAGRVPEDTGARTDIESGGVATVPGFLRSGFKFVFGDLDVSDLRRLWGMFRRLRTTEAFLLVEDPSEAIAEGVHWCTFVDLETYERRDASKSRLGMTVKDR